MTELLWLRNDLRVTDHPALAAAARAGRVVALFVSCKPQWQQHHWGHNKCDFIWRSVQALADPLAALGIPLEIQQADSFEAAAAVVLQVAQKHGARRVVWHREVGWHERQRDALATRLLNQQGIASQVYDDRFLVPPEAVLTGQGTPFKVFTPFRRVWLQRLAGSWQAPLPAPAVQGPALAPTPVAAGDFYAAAASPPAAAHWPAGEAQAQARLRAFCDGGLAHYDGARDYPALDGTSGLSPYLAAGAISARQCANGWLHQAGGDWFHPALDSWLNELAWRDFYQYIMWHFPRVSRNQPFVGKTRQLKWRNDEAGFTAWCEGRTGIPIVDAAMRQLHATGWMHNRLRMVVAMFLSKNLLIDWRRGEAFFMQQLVDGDFAANNGGWQWSASTGTDAAPYFRVFNPVSQSQRFDPKGDFLRQWLPELAALPDKLIHLPPAHLRGAYPAPLVDLKASRARAIEAFAAL